MLELTKFVFHCIIDIFFKLFMNLEVRLSFIIKEDLAHADWYDIALSLYSSFILLIMIILAYCDGIKSNKSHSTYWHRFHHKQLFLLFIFIILDPLYPDRGVTFVFHLSLFTCFCLGLCNFISIMLRVRLGGSLWCMVLLCTCEEIWRVVSGMGCSDNSDYIGIC